MVTANRLVVGIILMRKELANIVEQTPIYSDICETICPKCDSTNIKTLNVEHTLVGGDPDPNHFWRRSFCRDCELEFTHEHKLNNHWYTEKVDGVGRFVIKGVANCFESYVYTCNKCPGYVKRYYTELDGVTPHTKSLISSGVDQDGVWRPRQREFWGCVICDNVVETTNPPKPNAIKPLTGWTIVSEE